MQINIALSGFGHVGRAFGGLLAEKHTDLTRRYGLDMRLVLAANSRGAAHDGGGLDLKFLESLAQGGELADIPGFTEGLTGPEAVALSRASVWVEATPSHAKASFEPGMSNIKKALGDGMHAVTLCKGPLVHNFAEIMGIAQAAGTKVKYSGATAAALPTVDVAVNSLAGSRITSIEGILNGTSNFILTCMEREGLSFAQGLAEAQRRGIAEPEPSLDVEGWDTAYKLLIIANTLFEKTFSLSDMAVEGITRVGAADLKEAGNSGGTLKLVGSAELRKEACVLKTGPKFLPFEHPLAGVSGTTKGIHFVSDTMGPLTVIGGYSNPRGAAAAALKDIISLYML